uniref:Uncharacterized protein n=1 Tax=Rhizophora mucronata TaxID=61149 RepID=A0A2P2P949_RHIMU
MRLPRKMSRPLIIGMSSWDSVIRTLSLVTGRFVPGKFRLECFYPTLATYFLIKHMWV